MIDWNDYKEVGGNDQVTRYWPDRESPLKLGDEVAGILTKKNPRSNDTSASYLLEDGDEIILVWGGAVLDRKLESISPGTKIAIRYLGDKRNEKTKRTYKDFKVGILAIL